MLKFCVPNYFFFMRYFSIFILLITSTIGLQGCATVYRGLSPEEAADYVAKVAGTVKPVETKLYNFFISSDELKYIDGREVLCHDNKGTRNIGPVDLTIKRLILNTGIENTVQAKLSEIGTCFTTVNEETVMVGRYDNSYLYLHLPKNNTYILKYKINGRNLDFIGSIKHVNDVLSIVFAEPKSQSSHYHHGSYDWHLTRKDYWAYDDEISDQYLSDIKKEMLQEAKNSAWGTVSSYRRIASENKQASQEAERSIGLSIMQMGAENSKKLADIDRQTNEAIAESNRVRKEQAAARERARSENEANRREAEQKKRASNELIEKQAQALQQEKGRKLEQQGKPIDNDKQEQKLGQVKDAKLIGQKVPDEAKCVLQGTGICRGGAVTETRGGMFYVKQPNNCGYKLYARICIKTKSGRESCGSDSIQPGRSTSYWHASDDATGQFSVTSVGVLKGGDDWSCMGEKRRMGDDS